MEWFRHTGHWSREEQRRVSIGRTLRDAMEASIDTAASRNLKRGELQG